MNRRQPNPPVNVRAWTDDRKRSIPLDCSYDGWAHGTHNWVVVTPFDTRIYTSITIEEMPGKTSITVGSTSIEVPYDEGWGK